MSANLPHKPVLAMLQGTSNIRIMRLFLFLVCAAAFAQTQPRPAAKKAAPGNAPASAPDAVPTKWPIQSLTVEGNQAFTRDQVVAAAGLKVGQLAGKPDFEAARDRLVASG